MILPFKIAARFLKTGGVQNILIIAGIAIAISIQVFVSLLITSLQKTLVDRTITNSPQITIQSSQDINTIRDWSLMVDKIEHIDQVKAVAVSATGNAFVQDIDRSLPVIIRGFDFESADSLYKIKNSVYEGRPYQSAKEVLIGKDLAADLDANERDHIFIRTPDGKEADFIISGFFDLGTANINQSWLLANLGTVQRLFEYGNRITSIEVTVDDVFIADAIAQKINLSLENPGIEVTNWKEQNAELLSGLEGQRISSLVIQVVIVASMIVAISSVLAITVLQKSREIGILKAMGIKDFSASLIFMYEGFLIGLAGSTLGIILGLGLLYGFSSSTTSPQGVSVVDLYVENSFILTSWLIGLAASTFAGILPARKSLKLNPADVIREG